MLLNTKRRQGRFLAHTRLGWCRDSRLTARQGETVACGVGGPGRRQNEDPSGPTRRRHEADLGLHVEEKTIKLTQDI